MARTGRPMANLVLAEEERATLTRWIRRAKSSQALALRCKIVLSCAGGASSGQGRSETARRRISRSCPVTGILSWPAAPG
ncbi:hypothetical protein FMEAI12_2630016 [Parafrankia sp. Ea1.12]|nr:hypothetical protein FMEAI12_2630016 [Parafrankia sp. Ea1.12]